MIFPLRKPLIYYNIYKDIYVFLRTTKKMEAENQERLT